MGFKFYREHWYRLSSYLKKSLHSNSNINQFIPVSVELAPSFRFAAAEIVLSIKFISIVSTYFSRSSSVVWKRKGKSSKLKAHLAAVFFISSNMERGEMHPMVSHGEILQEKFAPYMLSWLPPLGGCASHSAANFLSFCSASVSPPTIEALATAFPSCKTIIGKHCYSI